ncbi:MAG: hypothetical protein MHM6MM_005930 [Cercozoa sp. M6MM]
MLSILVDPTVWFCIFCLIVPPGMAYLNGRPEEVIPFFLDRVPLSLLILLIATVLITHSGKTVKLSKADQMTARWYLLNGVLIHIGMDGLVGTLHQWKLFDEQYKIMDRRFIVEHSVPWTIGLIEITHHAPLALLTYYGYWHGKKWARLMEIVTCCFHYAGALFFVIPELKDGAINIPFDWNLDFTFHHVLYFWFCFGANFIWMFLPAGLAWRAGKRVVEDLEVSEKKAVKVKSL